MIDRNPNQPPTEPHDSRIVPTSPNDSANEIFNDLFPGSPASRTVTKQTPNPAAGGVQESSTAQPRMPVSPHTLHDSGLTLMQISNLVMKQLYLHDNLLGVDIARHIRLPFQVVDESIRFLKDSKVIEVSSGDVIGTASYRFNLTDLGNNRAREAFDQCRYVGPAPVPLDAYVKQCELQSVAATECYPEELSIAFSDMIIKPELLQELGPAVCSGKSIFIYGPPGNGKTMVAKGLGKFLNNRGGEIYVPYAIQAENSIITVFDPTLHETTDDAELARYESMSTAVRSGSTGEEYLDHAPDLRWRRIRRPVVITGGELTLQMLDLQYNETSAFYTAPLHIKSNGGVFLIDDFGRQILSPRDLLNRWILPLEERIDYLTLATGRKFSVPFEQLIIFSTNLDPRELVDEAFLRRIRHKIRIDSPNRELFTEIFQLACRARNIPYNPAAIDFLYLTYYDKGKPPRSSDPRDLLEIILSICRFRRQPVVLTPEIMAEATEQFFCQLY
jgi:hypothetical protein